MSCFIVHLYVRLDVGSPGAQTNDDTLRAIALVNGYKLAFDQQGFASSQSLLCRPLGRQPQRDDLSQELLWHDGLCFIEVQIDRNDCNKHLLEWGSRVSNNNGRSPVPTK